MIVLDLMMPVMDGREFGAACYQFSRAEPIPILLVSASLGLWQTRASTPAFGVRGFVSKPFDLAVLIGAVERLTQPAAVG